MLYGRKRRLGQVSMGAVPMFPGTIIPGYGSFHTAAFSASLAAVTNNDTAALTDGLLTIQNSHFLPPADVSINYAWAGGTTLARARFNSPKLRQIQPTYIRPISLLATPASNDNIMVLNQGQLNVRGLEELSAEITTTGAGPARATVVFGMMGNYVPPPMGDIYNFRATGATTAVANAWTQCPLTFEQAPPVGTYAVIGCEGIGATMIAFRLTFDGQFYRPGFIGMTPNSSRQLYATYYGKFGIWGYFRTTNLPRMEILCGAADTAQEFYLEVVRIS